MKDNKVDFDAFLKKNQDKIRKITPVNPTLSPDDELLEDDEWDRYYAEIKEN